MVFVTLPEVPEGQIDPVEEKFHCTNLTSVFIEKVHNYLGSFSFENVFLGIQFAAR